jgi:hypothetical protein
MSSQPPRSTCATSSVPASSVRGAASCSLASSTRSTFPQIDDGTHIALNWFRLDALGSFWHNGGSQGYSAFAAFNPEKDFAVVVLSNTAAEGDFFMDKVGWHVVQRLTGLPAVSLAPPPQ